MHSDLFPRSKHRINKLHGRAAKNTRTFGEPDRRQDFCSVRFLKLYECVPGERPKIVGFVTG